LENPPRIGVVGYTNKTSGIGVFVWEFWQYLKADSILSISSGIKGQKVWTDRQVTSKRPPHPTVIDDYLARFAPEVVLFIETPFSDQLYPLARKHGAKTVGIPMHETLSAERLESDLLICTCSSAWKKTRAARKSFLFLPIGLKLFPFRERTGHTFVVNIGYGCLADRRQSAKVVEAFKRIHDPAARLILHSQERWPAGVKVDDPRIVYQLGTKPEPADVYAEGDILLAPIAYGGYERSILEGMACGMPVLTVDADPLHLYQHDPNFLIPPAKQWLLNKKWVTNTVYNEVTVDQLQERMEWLLTIDTAKYSRRARAQAEAQSWESKEIDYYGTWIKALRSG